MNTKITTFIGGAVTAAAIGYSGIGIQKIYDYKNDYIREDINYELIFMQSEIYPAIYKPYYLNDPVLSEIAIIQKFVSSLIDNMVDTPAAYSKLVDENFWDLA